MSAVVWEEGRTVPAFLRRAVCEVCGLASTPGGLGKHRKWTGHGVEGWVRPEGTISMAAMRASHERVVCEVCGLLTTRVALGVHRKWTGHGVEGWVRPQPDPLVYMPMLAASQARAVCEVCGKVSTRGGLGLHRRWTGHGVEGWVPPPGAETATERKKQAARPARAAQPKPRNVIHFECLECKVTVPVYRMDRHLASRGHNYVPTPRFACTDCGKVLTGLFAAEQHRSASGHLWYDDL